MIKRPGRSRRLDISHFRTQPKALTGWDAALDRVETLRSRPYDGAAWQE
jgi:hypothetical protein